MKQSYEENAMTPGGLLGFKCLPRGTARGLNIISAPEFEIQLCFKISSYVSPGKTKLAFIT